MTTNQTVKPMTKEEFFQIEDMIDGLNSGKKECTLKQVKKDLSDMGITGVDTIKTKKAMVEFLHKLHIARTYEKQEQVKETSSLVVDTIPEEEPSDYEKLADYIMKPEPIKTRIATKNHDRIAALQSCLDLLYTVLGGFDGNTLKQNKKSISGILNTVSRKYLDDDIIFSITSLNKIAVKNEYKSHLKNETIPALQAGIDYELQLQEKEPVKIDISDKSRMLSPDMAMMHEQHDLKEKSRFDCLHEILLQQDKKIKSLIDMVQCHKTTISLLIDRLQSNKGNISSTKETSVKQDKKPVKSPEEIQIENRLAFIKSLKGIDKAVFSVMDKKPISENTIIALESLEDFTPKQVKIALKKLVDAGLLSFDGNSYTIAPVSSFTGETKDKSKTEKPANTDKKEDKKPKKKSFTRGNSSGKFTRKMAIQQAIEETMKTNDTFTMKDILEKQDKIFVAAGGNSNLKATNPTTAALKTLIAEGALKKEGKEYIVK